MPPKCRFCVTYSVIKKGQRRGLTRYHCQRCHKSFSSRRRPQTHQRKIWQEYIWFKLRKRIFTLTRLSPRPRWSTSNLEQLGYTLLAVVLDGRTGIPRVFVGWFFQRA